MAEVEIYTAVKMVEKEVEVYQLELSAAEFVSLRSFLAATSYNDIVKVDSLEGEDDKRIEAIYTAMSNLDGKKVKYATK